MVLLHYGSRNFIAHLVLCRDNPPCPCINMEVLSLLNFLDTYWRGTAEVNVEEN